MKDKIVQKLKDLGFKAENKEGIVLVYYKKGENGFEYIEKVRETLKKLNYNSSWGCQMEKENRF